MDEFEIDHNLNLWLLAIFGVPIYLWTKTSLQIRKELLTNLQDFWGGKKMKEYELEELDEVFKEAIDALYLAKKPMTLENLLEAVQNLKKLYEYKDSAEDLN